MQATNAIVGELLAAAICEDCLSLNVWTPAVDDGRRPVLVWLHGGAFLTGAGSSYNGAELARRGDVVVVTVNYRLGLCGYLRGVDVCGDALPSTGNEGLLDQLAALTWVKHEIAAFGGDPENVTAFGQSAGAVSTSAMLSMPQARGLFHKAILQSGSVRPLLQPPAAANRVMEAILADVGLAPNEAGRLQELPATQLLDVQARVTPRAGGVFYRPVADGMEVSADPVAAIAAGSAAGIPLLVGTNLEEQKFHRRLDPEVDHLTDEGLLARLADARWNAQAADHAQFDPAEAMAAYRHVRAARGESTTAQELWFAMFSDRRYRGTAMRLAELHRRTHAAHVCLSLHLEITGLEWATRRGSRGRITVRIRGPRHSRCARFRTRWGKGRNTQRADAGCLDRFRPHGQPADIRAAGMGAVYRPSPMHDAIGHAERPCGCAE
jgi:carboxylesterase type B